MIFLASFRCTPTAISAKLWSWVEDAFFLFFCRYGVSRSSGSCEKPRNPVIKMFTSHKILQATDSIFDLG